MRVLVAAVAAVALAAGAVEAAGAQERACTQIGCSSGLSLRLTDDSGRLVAPRAHYATLCIDEECERFRARGQFVRLDVPDQDGEGPVRVRIVLRDRSNRVVSRFDRRIRLTRFQPNGPQCDPVCWQAAYRLRGDLRVTRTA